MVKKSILEVNCYNILKVTLFFWPCYGLAKICTETEPCDRFSLSVKEAGCLKSNSKIEYLFDPGNIRH